MFTDEFKVKVRESNKKGKKTDTDRKDNSNSEGQKDRRRGEVKNNWERKMREIRIKKRLKKWEKDGWGTSEKGQHS